MSSGEKNPLRRMMTNPLWLTLAALLLAGLYYIYFVRIINTYNHTGYGWLRAHWRDISHYSHGPLIPLIAIGLLWWKRDEFRGVAPQPDSRGLWIVGLAMLIYYVSIRGMVERLVVLSFILFLYGLTWSLGGRAVLRLAFFPITFLFLMIPLNFIEERVGLPLQYLMATCSTWVLNGVGIETQQVGTTIYSSVFHFDVAAPCSGIRSLMALTTVTAAYAYVTQVSQWKRWALFLSALPLAVLGNMARVISIALVASVYGQDVALKAYHDWSGYIVFAVALGLMVFIGWLLDLPYARIWKNWTRPVQPRNAVGTLS